MCPGGNVTNMNGVLDPRTSRRVWAFLIGATVSEAIALAYVFQPRTAWLPSLARLIFDPPGTLTGWIGAALVAGAYSGYAVHRSAVMREYAFYPRRWGPFLAVRLFAIPMALVTAVFEEVMFRKIVMDGSLHAGAGPSVQILWSAFAFGIVHAVWGLFKGNVAAALAAMAATTVLGGSLAVVYIASDRSLAPCIASHFVISLILEPWLVLTFATAAWGKTATA
jgi:hypothetical protein